jgi:hypothetical protein
MRAFLDLENWKISLECAANLRTIAQFFVPPPSTR